MSASTTNAKVPTIANFLIGGISGMIAQAATHPMDVLKIRMQLSRNTLSETMFNAFNISGVRGFYVGLGAALLRQLTYTTTRLGTYNTLLDIGEEHVGRLNYITMISLGMFAGMMGSFVGTPTDLVLVRTIADINLPSDKRKNYRNAISGIIDIWKTEGFTKLWRGAMPTMFRAAIVNGMQLGTYTRAKMLLRDTGFKDGVLLQFLAAMTSGIITSFTSLPMDVAKTRIQNWKSTKTPGIVTMMIKIARTEGIRTLWRGFLPYYCRAGPNTIITMVCVDQFHQMYLEIFPVS